MKGLHYSSELLNIGDIIKSNQKSNSEKLFKRIWSVYKETANSLNLYFPNDYGYAYPLSKLPRTQFPYLYEIEAHDDYVAKGNFNHSVYFNMTCITTEAINLRNQGVRANDRKILIDEWIKEESIKYFTKVDNEEEVEFISDKFQIVSIKSL